MDSRIFLPQSRTKDFSQSRTKDFRFELRWGLLPRIALSLAFWRPQGSPLQRLRRVCFEKNLCISVKSVSSVCYMGDKEKCDNGF
ncbi:MAG: hypothetical protein FWH18_09635 [Marinilabiliaceae bacterium]|nr:hypothetical protein [Marinilabiliaceae bacterium]